MSRIISLVISHKCLLPHFDELVRHEIHQSRQHFTAQNRAWEKDVANHQSSPERRMYWVLLEQGQPVIEWKVTKTHSATELSDEHSGTSAAIGRVVVGTTRRAGVSGLQETLHQAARELRADAA